MCYLILLLASTYKGRQEIDTLVTCMNSVVTTIKTAENFSEMRVYTMWAYMATLGGVT